MKHSDFEIGAEFYTAAGKWRCLHVTYCNDPSDFAGPPYAFEEVVFDEYDFEGCYPTESGLESRKELLHGDDRNDCYENEIDEILVRLEIWDTDRYA